MENPRKHSLHVQDDLNLGSLCPFEVTFLLDTAYIVFMPMEKALTIFACKDGSGSSVFFLLDSIHKYHCADYSTV